MKMSSLLLGMILRAASSIDAICLWALPPVCYLSRGHEPKVVRVRMRIAEAVYLLQLKTQQSNYTIRPRLYVHRTSSFPVNISSVCQAFYISFESTSKAISLLCV